MAQRFELRRAVTPTREEKRRLARAMGLADESLVYKWAEDPDGSGRPNPIDKLEIIMDHALLHHPDAALAIAQHLETRITRALSRAASGLSRAQLVTQLQPATEKEAIEAVRAFGRSLVQLVATGDCDLPDLLREVEEGERQLKAASVMIRGVIQAGGPTAAAS